MRGGPALVVLALVSLPGCYESHRLVELEPCPPVGVAEVHVDGVDFVLKAEASDAPSVEPDFRAFALSEVADSAGCVLSVGVIRGTYDEPYAHVLLSARGTGALSVERDSEDCASCVGLRVSYCLPGQPCASPTDRPSGTATLTTWEDELGNDVACIRLESWMPGVGEVELAATAQVCHW